MTQSGVTQKSRNEDILWRRRVPPSKAPPTYVLHPFDVGLNLLHDPGIPLHLLRTLHALVDPLGHLLDVALGIDEERVVGVVLWCMLQQVLPWGQSRAVTSGNAWTLALSLPQPLPRCSGCWGWKAAPRRGVDMPSRKAE